jgi:hypothetical protein
MDVLGTLVMVVATTTLILGFTWLGMPDRVGLGALQILISAVAWFAFIRIEQRAEAPILDPQVLFNRILSIKRGNHGAAQESPRCRTCAA